MQRFTLYSGPLSMFGAKAQIAALEKGLDFELVMVPFDFEKLYTPRHPEVLRVNPKRQVPVLVDGDLALFDSTQIFEYLEDLRPQPPLWPADVRERARARLLEHQSDEVYFPHVVRLMGLQSQLDEAPARAAIEAAQAFCLQVERLLAGREWLAGGFGFADIAFYMASLFGERLGAPFTGDMPRLLAWRERMTRRPAVAQVAGAMARYLASVGRPVPAFLRGLL
ncbi:glutathione S-transferase family protein [Ramlibacter montanisoli]|uniref:Glutathione S-transferase family protein n=1 Tax=Ramlibacter montanisoli TaxID=2732512 RepID=A0A849K8E2_9BURK|nr:glutathione S-transferase family protein [Ramlibacter montanisoli]NNU44598.1 glutathione S-transferase family protein [Ramlibacter montanisoli]